MIPPRIRKGDPIGKLADYWNILIDHLNETRLVSGKGISINRMPAGTVIKTTAVNQGGTTSVNSKSTAYRGHFRVEDISEDDILKVEVHGGQTDLGSVMGIILSISESTSIYLMAEYIHTDDKNGFYWQTVTINPGNDRTSDEYALWLIADVSVREHSGGAKYLEIVQQWQSGAIYWGSRYWI